MYRIKKTTKFYIFSPKNRLLGRLGVLGELCFSRNRFKKNLMRDSAKTKFREVRPEWIIYSTFESGIILEPDFKNSLQLSERLTSHGIMGT